jgi:acyl-CoA synthetase (NDP forming)
MSKDEIIALARQEKRTQLTEVESKEIVREAGLPVIRTALARSQRQAVSLARQIGFPVVLKVASPDIVHKSDVGGVKMGLASAARVERAYREILAGVRAGQPGARVHGVSVQAMARPGVEVIMGMTKDAQFGPVLMFGLGGILVELLKDISFRIVPLTRRDAADMVREVKGYPLLEGFRGREGADVTVLEDMLVKLSGFIEKTPEIREMDLNPVIGYKDGAVVVDARIVLEVG